jgi:hypothetical protein
VDPEIRQEDPFAAARLVRAPANASMAGLAINVALHVVAMGFACFDLLGGRPRGGVPQATTDRMLLESSLAVVLYLITGIFFLQWVSRAFRAALRLHAVPKRFTARSVIWGFVLPILNLFRPFQGLSELEAAIDPLRVPEPPPQPETTAHAGGYRQAAFAGGAPAWDGKRPPIAGWWGLWVAGAMLGALHGAAAEDWTALRVYDLVFASLQAASAAMAIVVVHRFGLMLTERARRLAAR